MAPVSHLMLEAGAWIALNGASVADIPPPPPPDPDPGPEYSIVFSGSGSIDNAPAFAAQLDLIPDGTALAPTLIHMPYGTYRYDGQLSFDNRRHLIVDAIGFATHTDVPGWVDFGNLVQGVMRSNRQALRFSNSDHVIWRGGDLNGSHAADRSVNDPRFGKFTDQHAGEHGIYVGTNCQFIEITDVEVKDMGGDCLYVGINAGVRPTDITFRRITGGWTGRQTIAVTSAERVLFADCNLQWGGRAGLDVEPINLQYQAVRDLTLLRCTMNAWFYPYSLAGILGIGGFAPGYGVWDDGSPVLNRRTNISLIDCVGIHNNGSYEAVHAVATGINLTVTGHTDTSAVGVQGMTVAAWENVLIDDCTVSVGTASGTTYGVKLQGVSGTCSVTNSDFNGAVEGADQLFLLADAPSGALYTGTCVGSTDLISAYRNLEVNNSQIVVDSITSGSPGLTVGQTYYVINATIPVNGIDIGTFKVALTQGGAAINLGDGVIKYRHYWPLTPTPTHSGNTWAMGTASD